MKRFIVIIISLFVFRICYSQINESDFKSLNLKKVDYLGNQDTKYIFKRMSDVDIDIPNSEKKIHNRFALIIGNEDYASFQKDLKQEANVEFARNDASAFKEYSIKLLGIPENNIIFLLDATKGQIIEAVQKTKLLIKTLNGQAEVFFYYAGHGLPNENSKDSYIIPVDINGENVNNGILLQSIYDQLTEFPSQRITVFIDACFSGGARSGELISHRGIKVTPKSSSLNGDIIVLTATNGFQSANPLKDQKHGIFTYYLLKNIKSTKGNISYEELHKEIEKDVSIQSILINGKEQTPQIKYGKTDNNKLENIKIN